MASPKKNESAALNWQVEVIRDGKVLKVYPLQRERTFIGRMDQNQIILDDTSVSRTHAMIQKEREQLFLIDQGSQNGTYVNGKVVLREVIRPGDLVTIGPFTLKVQPADMASPSSK